MVDRDAAQAAMLIRALCDLRKKMIGQMIWLQKNDAKRDAAALQRDINEAESYITRLQHRYLIGEVGASQSQRVKPRNVGAQWFPYRHEGA